VGRTLPRVYRYQYAKAEKETSDFRPGERWREDQRERAKDGQSSESLEDLKNDKVPLLLPVIPGANRRLFETLELQIAAWADLDNIHNHLA